MPSVCQAFCEALWMWENVNHVLLAECFTEHLPSVHSQVLYEGGMAVRSQSRQYCKVDLLFSLVFRQWKAQWNQSEIILLFLSYNQVLHFRLLFTMTSVLSWYIYVSLCPGSFCTPRPNLPWNTKSFQVSLDFLLLHCNPLWWKGHLFLVLVLEGVAFYRTR